MKAVVLNDTRRDAGHLGCDTVMRAIEFLCEAAGIEIVASFRNPRASEERGFMDSIRRSDAVIVNGEGSMHHDMPNAMNIMQAAVVAKENGLKIHLVNSLWQDNPMLERHLDIFDSIAVRESLSARQIRAAGFECRTVPDLSMFCFEGETRRTASGRGEILYTDSVIPSVTKFLIASAFRQGSEFRYMVHPRGWKGRAKEMAAAAGFVLRGARCGILRDDHLNKPLVTGRFHAVCLAIKYGLPFLAVGSNSHKMEGTLIDAGIEPAEVMFKGSDYRDLVNRTEGLYGHWTPAPLLRDYVERGQTEMKKTFHDIARC